MLFFLWQGQPAVSEELADHFKGISLEFDGLSLYILTSTSSALKILSRAEVKSKLKKTEET